jgi:hypothetical protein
MGNSDLPAFGTQVITPSYVSRMFDIQQDEERLVEHPIRAARQIGGSDSLSGVPVDQPGDGVLIPFHGENMETQVEIPLGQDMLDRAAVRPDLRVCFDDREEAGILECRL